MSQIASELCAQSRRLVLSHPRCLGGAQPDDSTPAQMLSASRWACARVGELEVAPSARAFAAVDLAAVGWL